MTIQLKEMTRDTEPRQENKMSHSSRSQKTTIIALILGSCAVIFPLLGNQLFPENGGFTRTLLFIRPTATSSGYFVLYDEFHTTKPVDLAFHSRGVLVIGENSAAWRQGDLAMNLSFVGQVDRITGHQGLAYAHSETEDIDYIKVRLNIGSRRLITIIQFNNATEPNSQVPQTPIEGTNFQGAIINGTDLMVIQPTASTSSWTYQGTSSDARFLFLRAGEDGDSFGVARGVRLLTQDGTQLISLSNRVDSICIDEGKPLVPSLEQGFGLSENPVSPSPRFSKLVARVGGSQPRLLLNESDLPELRARVSGSFGGPWKTWYSSLGSDILSRAFRSRIAENQSLIEGCAAELMQISNLYSEREQNDMQDIARSTFLSPYIVAYDMIRSNLTSNQRLEIDNQLRTLVEHLYEGHQKAVIPLNNHIVVTATAIGLAGLLLDIPAWVDEAQQSVDGYLQDTGGIRPNGACYEGASYADYTFRTVAPFFYALRNAGGYDFFTHPKFQAWLNYTVSSMSPLGYAPTFEDCAVNRTLGQPVLMSIGPVQESNPTLAGELQWYWERTGSIHWGGAYDIVMYDQEVPRIEPDTGPNDGIVYPADGYAVFRSGWGVNDLYAVISNKDFLQSHVHQDENSLEIYACGKKWLTNPGYPGWAHAGHDWAISAEASNTALINGQGQFRHNGDGFSAGLLHEKVDFVVSPTRVTYQNPYNPLVWRGFQLLWVALIVLGCSYLVLTKREIHKRSEARKMEAETTHNAEINSMSLNRFEQFVVHHEKFFQKWSFLLSVGLSMLYWTFLLVPIGMKTHYFILHGNMTPDLRDTLIVIIPLIVIGMILLFGFLKGRQLKHRWSISIEKYNCRGEDRFHERWVLGYSYLLLVLVLITLGVGTIFAPYLMAMYTVSGIDAGAIIINAIYIAQGVEGFLWFLLTLETIVLVGKYLHAKFVGKLEGWDEKLLRGVQIDYLRREIQGLLVLILILFGLIFVGGTLMYRIGIEGVTL